MPVQLLAFDSLAPWCLCCSLSEQRNTAWVEPICQLWLTIAMRRDSHQLAVTPIDSMTADQQGAWAVLLVLSGYLASHAKNLAFVRTAESAMIDSRFWG